LNHRDPHPKNALIRVSFRAFLVCQHRVLIAKREQDRRPNKTKLALCPAWSMRILLLICSSKASGLLSDPLDEQSEKWIGIRSIDH